MKNKGMSVEKKSSTVNEPEGRTVVGAGMYGTAQVKVGSVSAPDRLTKWLLRELMQVL